MRKTFLVTPLLLGCLLGAGSAQAQGAPKELTEEDIKRLAAMVDNADKLFSASKYEDALPIYQSIYDQTSEPTMLYRIALCQEKLNRPKDAVASYQRFLKEAPADNSFREKAESSMKEQAALIPKDAQPDPEPEPPKPPKKKSTFLYAGAGATGVAGIAFGILGLQKAIDASKGEPGAGDLQDKANQFGLISDVAFVATIGLGVGGYLLSKKEKEQVTLLIGPTRVALSVEF
jgi:tetratricopeptide (TPR) repeat protein